MTTRKLVALGTALAFLSLSGIGFAADQKAAGTQAPAATSAAPAGDTSGAPAKTKKNKKKHSTSSTSGASGSTATPKN